MWAVPDASTKKHKQRAGIAFAHHLLRYKHSCAPNAEVAVDRTTAVDGVQLRLLAKRDICKGEDITASRIPQPAKCTKEQRTAMLAALGIYPCACTLCYGRSASSVTTPTPRDAAAATTRTEHAPRTQEAAMAAAAQHTTTKTTTTAAAAAVGGS